LDLVILLGYPSVRSRRRAVVFRVPALVKWKTLRKR
jgi:hypothetical protein